MREALVRSVGLRSYAYAPNGQLLSTSLPAGGGLAAETVTTEYDALSIPERMSGGSGFGPYVAGSAYSAFGQALAYDLGVSSVAVGYSYEYGTRRLDRTWVSRAGGSGFDLDLTYAYDPAGNPVSVVDSPTVGAVDAQCYAYDGLRRLTSAWTPGDGDCDAPASVAGLGGPAPYWTDYAFDAVGSRTTVTEHAAGGDTTSTYAYPVPGGDGPHQVSAVTQVGPGGVTTDTFVYDDAGATVERALAGEPVQSLVWDVEGELVEVLEGTGTVGEYTYTADGERLVRRQGFATTVYLPGGQELTLDGLTQEVTATRYYTFNGSVVATRTDPGVTGAAVLISDPHGTAELVVDGSGVLTRRRDDPYGNPRGVAPTAWPGDHGFLDKPLDDTGLVAIGARYYDPALGAFISVDPIMDLTDPQQWHGYAYANNNPITYTDPTGLAPQDYGYEHYASIYGYKVNQRIAASFKPPVVINSPSNPLNVGRNTRPASGPSITPPGAPPVCLQVLTAAGDGGLGFLGTATGNTGPSGLRLGEGPDPRVVYDTYGTPTSMINENPRDIWNRRFLTGANWITVGKMLPYMDFAMAGVDRPYNYNVLYRGVDDGGTRLALASGRAATTALTGAAVGLAVTTLFLAVACPFTAGATCGVAVAVLAAGTGGVAGWGAEIAVGNAYDSMVSEFVPRGGYGGSF